MRDWLAHARYIAHRFAEPQPARAIALALATILFTSAGAFAQQSSAQADTSETVIGEIVGRDFTVKGQVGIALREGRVVTRLESGNEVTVHRGQALVRLANGGSIRLCQPMKVSLLKSAAGLTVALERGTVRIEVRGGEALSLHTPWFTISVPREENASVRALLAGLDAEGKLCLKTLAGDCTVREQLGTGQLAVPAGNEYLIEPDKLTEPRRTTDACTCPEENLEEPAAQPTPSASTSSSEAPAANTPASFPATVARASPGEAGTSPTAQPAPPEWKAIMPPLVYQAGAESAPPQASDAPAILVPATWQGVVTPGASGDGGAARKASSRRGFVERVKNFFRALFGGGRKKAASG